MTDSDNLSRRRFLQGTGGVAAAAALAGCGGDGGDGGGDTTTTEDDGGEETTTTTEQQEQKRTYQLVGATASTFDPIKATDTASGAVIQNVFEALTNYPNGQTNVENLIAKSVSVADDDVSYTFELKEGVTYSNGNEVVASDLVYSFERLAASDNSRRKGFILGDLGIEHETETVTVDGEEQEQYKPGTLNLSADGDYTLKMKLSKPFHASLAMLAYTSFSAIPEGIVGDIEGYDGEMSHEEFATKNPIGSGPFTLESWEKGTSRDLKARPMDEYHRDGPFVKGVHIQVIEKTNPAYTYATTNMNADHPSVPSSKYDGSKVSIEGTDDRGREYGTYGPLENGLTADYYKLQELGTYYFGFNCDNVEKPVRQAFAHVYNQKEVTEQVYKGRLSPAFFFTPPAIFPGGANKYQEMAKEYPYGHNKTQISEAKSLMEEAGYSSDNKYQLTMTTYESSTMKQIGQIMRDKLSAVHINMKYEQAPFSTLLTRATNGNLECYSLGWIADYPAPDNFLKLLVPTQSQTGDEGADSVSSFDWGAAAGEDDDASGMTDAAQRAEDAWSAVAEYPLPSEDHKSKRNEAYLEIEKANWEDAVMITTFHSTAEHMDYPWLDKPRVGAMGSSRQKWNNVKVGDRSEHKN